MYIELVDNETMVRVSFDDDAVHSDYAIKLDKASDIVKIMCATDKWYVPCGTTASQDIYAPYCGKLYKAFDDIVVSDNKSKCDQEVKKYKFNVCETSKLVYRPSDGTIHLALRRDKDVNTKNIILISDTIRDEFIDDCKKSVGWDFNYALNSDKDKIVYEKWVSYIQAERLKNNLR